MGLIYAIILIGVLVFVHELGHFIVAKLFNVKVLQFAIGYGPSIISYKYGETEYCIKALPLGGYVLMLGSALDEIDDIPEQDRSRALMGKPIWQRALVSFAGPAANILFPAMIYFIMTLTTPVAQPAVIGEVFADMPAASAGLQPGDKVTKIDGKPISYWFELQKEISANPEVALPIEYSRHETSHRSTITPKSSFQTDSLGLARRTFGLIGVTYNSYGPTIAVPDPNSSAARAGLQTFDKIIEVNGDKITRYDELSSKLRARNLDGGIAKLMVLRPIPVDVDWGRVYRNDVVTIELPVVAEEAGGLPSTTSSPERYGIDSGQMYLSHIEAGSPAEKAGLLPKDKVLSVNGVPFKNWLRVGSTITNQVNAKIVEVSKKGEDPEKMEYPFEITYIRDGKEGKTSLFPSIRKLDKQEAYRVILGFNAMHDYVQPDSVEFPFIDRIPAAFESAVSDTWNVIKLTATGVWGMITGRFGLDNLGGPIMIGNLAAKAGDAGIKPFLNMMGLISVNLALMNLLPIPMFDGGHLVIYLVEAIQRRPISFRTRQIITYVGLVIIFLLFVMAFKNDIERSWDDIVSWLNQ